MGLKERITQQKQAMRDAEEAEEARAKLVERERNERYSRELPEMILAQRPLLLELRDIGVLALLEEMTYPEEIHFPQTEAEKKAEYREGPDLPPVSSISKVDPEEARRIVTELQNQQWGGGVQYPEQLADGSPDSTLRIRITNDIAARRMYRRIHHYTPQWVDIAYSQDRHLTVLGGKGPTFYEFVDVNNPDMSAIELGLARAFIDPIEESPTPPIPHFHTRY